MIPISRLCNCNLYTYPFLYWYHLLKLLQKHGAIEKFDLLFHRTGPLAGQPRGYAFVTYKSKEEAVAAKELLHNMLIGQKRITATWAHSVNNVITFTFNYCMYNTRFFYLTLRLKRRNLNKKCLFPR